MKSFKQSPIQLGPISKLESQAFTSKNSDEDLQNYLKILQNNFSHYQNIKSREQKGQFQRVIYCCLLVKLFEMKDSSVTNLSQIKQQFRKYHNHVMHIQDFRGYNYIFKQIMDVVINDPDQINLFNDKYDIYMCQLLRAICDIKPPSGISWVLSKISQPSPKYEKAQFQKIKKAIGYTYFFFNFDQKKKLQEPFSVDLSGIYLLKVKNHYYYLIPNTSQRGLMQISKQPTKHIINMVSQAKVSANKLEQIFLKQGELPKNKKQKSQKGDIFFPNKVQCSVCSIHQSQFDCLHWNYTFYCQSCLLNPLVNTSSIPANLLQKFLKEREILINQFPLQCPQCKSTHVFRKYDPTKKPSFFVCEKCRKTICTDHLCMVQSCFCYCKTCKKQTMNIPHLNIKICQFCNKKKCNKCGSQSKKLCSCICKSCLGDNKQNHLCQKKCHSCLNAIPSLKNCQCGMPICYGCYYRFYQHSQNGHFNCSFIDFQ